MKEIANMLNMKHSTVHSVIEKNRDTVTASDTVTATPNTRKLKEELKRCVMVMDNMPFHRNRDVKSVIEDIGHKLMRLPLYSPFFNTIGNMFGKWKSLVKRSKPLNEDDLKDAISNGSSLISRDDCEGFVRHMLSNIQKCINGEVSFT